MMASPSQTKAAQEPPKLDLSFSSSPQPAEPMVQVPLVELDSVVGVPPPAGVVVVVVVVVVVQVTPLQSTVFVVSVPVVEPSGFVVVLVLLPFVLVVSAVPGSTQT
jgi:hypothetical protein